MHAFDGVREKLASFRFGTALRIPVFSKMRSDEKKKR
jgi:hypothetical protein